MSAFMRCQARDVLTLFDFIDHTFGRLLGYIVDDNVGAELSEHERISATETSPCTGDDDRLVFEPNSG